MYVLGKACGPPLVVKLSSRALPNRGSGELGAQLLPPVVVSLVPSLLQRPLMGSLLILSSGHVIRESATVMYARPPRHRIRGRVTSCEYPYQE